MKYGYGRCSTDENKQDIQRQIRELEELGIKKENVYFEYASGIKEDRTELKKLLSIVKAGDSIYATEVSRISRSTKQLCDILELAKNKKIKLVLGTFVVNCIDNLDPMTERNVKVNAVYSVNLKETS